MVTFSFKVSMINGKPTIILLLSNDIKKYEEMSIDYGWMANSSKQRTLCRCSYSECGMFMEKDVNGSFGEFIRKFKKIDQPIKVTNDSKFRWTGINFN